MTKKRWLYLKYYCLQYVEKKEELEKFTYYKSPSFEEAPGSGGSFKGGLENKIVRKILIEKHLEIIENIAIRTAKDLAPYLLENVTKGTPFEFLDVPTSRRNFFRIKSAFFNELDEFIF